MGLTIGWRLTLAGEPPRAEVAERLEAMRRAVAGLPFRRLDARVKSFSSAGLGEMRLARVPVPLDLLIAEESGGVLEFEAREAVFFRADPAQGAEPAWFGVARYGEPVPGADPALVWHGSWVAKTQDAGGPQWGGAANFLRAHLSIVAALDEAARAGFGVRVEDDGRYWGRRSVDVLLEELAGSEHRLAATAGRLKDAWPEGSFRGKGILARPDFERLEARAAPPVPAGPWPADVADLIERTGGR
jgi:hypothetical protein